MREVLLYGRRIVDMGSRFFSERHKTLVAYTPGEQPQGGSFIKLNTNELPYAPTEAMLSRAAELTRSLNLYPDPDCRVLRRELADRYGVTDEEILVTNGSDEILSFAFLAFCDRNHPAVFPDITYGFYKVWADLYGIPYRTIPLRDDFSVEPRDYLSDDSVVLPKISRSVAKFTASCEKCLLPMISPPLGVVIFIPTVIMLLASCN